MNTPLVSIIIPTYNRAHLIGETLDSVLAQTYTNWECIIVDDGSTDNTDEVVERYLKCDSRFQYYIRPEGFIKGANSCRNYGFELSKGEYINWFDSDDIMLPDFLKIKTDYINEKKYNVIICSGYFVDNRRKILRELNYYDAKNLFKTYSMYKSEIITDSVLVKRDFITKDYLFNLNLSRGQETEFFHRLFFSLDNNDYKYTDKKLFYYRQHHQSITSQDKEFYDFKNRFSQAYTAMENIKRGFLLKDEDIINHMHKFSLSLLFLALNFKDLNTSGYILKNYEENYFGANKNVIFYIKLYVNVLYKFKILNNKIESSIKKMKLKSF